MLLAVCCLSGIVTNLTELLSGTFGFVSAIFLESDEHLSNVFNVVSVQLYLLEALLLLTRRQAFYAARLVFWIRLADICFTLGAVMDVAVGYAFLYNTNLRLVRVDVAAQVFWLVCAVIWLATTLYAKMHGAFDESVSPHPKPLETPEEKDVEQVMEVSPDKQLTEGKKATIWAGQSLVDIDATDSSHSGKEHVA